MNYIWDVVLNAEQSGFNRNELFFRQAEDYSPWYEQAFSSMNQKGIDSTEIEINALCRFHHIFQGILHPDMAAMPEFRLYLFDLIVHLLCEIELRKGLTKQEFYIRKLEQEILGGKFGAKTAENYNLFTSKQKGDLAALLLNQIKTGTSLYLFRKSLKAIFPDAILYQLKLEKEQLLLYIGHKKTEKHDYKLNFLLEMFLPIDYQLRTFWEYHFGVIGVDASMHIDQLEIF